jgi:murein tripeptide amidase MpaA
MWANIKRYSSFRDSNTLKPRLSRRRLRKIPISKQKSPKTAKKHQRTKQAMKRVKKCTSRVHPGESQASHMVEGLINFITSDHPEAVEIRSKFVIKIIPMLNPDGVIFGNYRSSLLGVDLNRRWKKPSKYLHPEIYYAK